MFKAFILTCLLFVGVFASARNDCLVTGQKFCANAYTSVCIAQTASCPAGLTEYTTYAPRPTCDPYIGCICDTNPGVVCDCTQLIDPNVFCYQPATASRNGYVGFNYISRATTNITIPISECYNAIYPGPLSSGQPTNFLPGTSPLAFTVPKPLGPVFPGSDTVCWILGGKEACFTFSNPGNVPLCASFCEGNCTECTSGNTDEVISCVWCPNDTPQNGTCEPSAANPNDTCPQAIFFPENCPSPVGGPNCSNFTTCETCIDLSEGECVWCAADCTCQAVNETALTCLQASVQDVVITNSSKCPTSFNPSTACPVKDLATSLTALYNAAGGASWTRKANWATATDPCTWEGIDCVAKTIILNNNNLNGIIPENFWCGVGDFKVINFADNNIMGRLYPTIGFAVSAQHLIFSQNDLVGEVPAYLCNIGNALQYFYVDDNCMACEIPACMPEMDALQEVHFEANEFIGVISTAWLNTPDLFEIHFECNNFVLPYPTFLEDLRAAITARGRYTANIYTVPNLDLAGTGYTCAELHPKPCLI